MTINRCIPLVLAITSLAACGSGEVGVADVEFRAGGVSALGPQGLATEDEDGDELQIVAARAHVRHIELDFADDDLGCAQIDEELEAPVSCKDDEKIVISGPFEVDLLTGESSPSLEGLTIPSAVYRRADVRIQSEDGPAFQASVGVDADVSSVHVALDFTEDARFEDDEGVLLDGEAQTLLLRLDADAWFRDVPLTACVRDGEVEVVDDQAVIDEDTSGHGGCSDVENDIKDNIEASGSLQPG